MGEERSHKDSSDLELNPAAANSVYACWMQFPPSRHTESLRNSSGGGYVTLIRSSALRQSSCTESQARLVCLLWNLATLKKWFPRLQFFSGREVRIAGRSLVGRERYRSCGKRRAVFWLRSSFMPLCDARSFGSQVFHTHVFVLQLFEILTGCFGI